MNKEQRTMFLRCNWRLKTLCFRWNRSGTCRIYDFRGDFTKFYAGGYGYDKQGTCLAKLMNYYFSDELKKLNSDKFYGLSHYNSKTCKYQKRASKNTRSSVNGACGFESMRTILNKIGFKLTFIYEDNNCNIYRLEA
tara:strand:- start:94 stop:504 length:411 start_codon:yes stop_codon:yes gene_type:complete